MGKETNSELAKFAKNIFLSTVMVITGLIFLKNLFPKVPAS